MADPKTAATKNEANTAKAPEAAPVKEKAPKVKAVMVDSAEAAIAEAAKRTKGPRRPFKVTHGGKDYFCVAHNEGRAAGFVLMSTLGGSVEELGKTKKVKQIGVDGIMNAVNALPEAERKLVLEQLKSLGAPKK